MVAIGRADLHAIVELAHLRIVAAWEHFLEETFVRLLYGARPRGVRVRCHVSAPSLEEEGFKPPEPREGFIGFQNRCPERMRAFRGKHL